jgi:hypothetical protein
LRMAHVVRPVYVLLQIGGGGVVVVVVVGAGVLVVVVGAGVVVVVVVGVGVVVVVVGTGVVVVVGAAVVEVVVGGVGVVKLTHCSLFLPKHHPDLSVIKKSGVLIFAQYASTVMSCTEFTLHVA